MQQSIITWRLMVVDNIIMGLKSVLTPMEEEDLKLIKSWASDPLICNNYHKSLVEEENFLKELISGGNDHVKAYTINTEDSKAIGKLTIEIGDDNTANMDILIGEKIYIGKGYGKDALKAAIKHCFEYLNLDVEPDEFWSWDRIFDPLYSFMKNPKDHKHKFLEPRVDFFKKHPSQIKDAQAE